jgi:hypothetical protein
MKAALSPPPSPTSEKLHTEMKRLLSSDNSVDIATLAYVWGFPIISNMRTIDHATDPQYYSESESNGPWNEFHYNTVLADASFKQIVSPNVDTLYSYVYYDLENEPLIIQIPNGISRYFTLQFIDAYTTNYHYIGTRTTGTNGGTYILTGRNWNATVPENIVEIKSPTNFGLVFGRVLVNGPDDLKEAIRIEQSLKASPLSVYENKTTMAAAVANITKKDPIRFYSKSISGLPQFIPLTGPKLFDELAYYIAKNMPPANQSDIVDKFANLGITPNSQLNNQSQVDFNSTTAAVLEKGISNGEKLIDQRYSVGGKNVNNWKVNTNIGKFPDDYLGRASMAKFGLWGNNAEEAIFPFTSRDANGKSLNGANNNSYILHFGNGQLPPVKKNGFWSITVYTAPVQLLHDNPINRYVINDRTQGIKYNDDGSLDICLQNRKPSDPQRQTNWFPIPDGPFVVVMRIYLPQQSVFDGQYQPPPIRLA